MANSLTKITEKSIKDGEIVNADINASAAIAKSKLASLDVVNADVNASAAIDATKLSYTQADSGASARTIDSKLEDFVSVKDFGATGDGSTNDATAFTNALATEKAIYVPAGTYVIGSTLDIDDKNVTMFGDGERLSILKFTGGTDGLNWTSSDDTHSLVLEKLEFQTSVTMSGSPVDANFGVTVGTIRPGVSLENVVASFTGSGKWTKGFRFNSCRNSNIIECIFNGVYATSTYGFKFTGQCLDTKAERCQANDIGGSSGQAFLIDGTCEGVQIISALAINTKIGVDHATPATEPYLSVIGCHFNTRQFGVRMSKGMQSIISNNLFYADTENAAACEDYTAVSILANDHNDHNNISDNIFHGDRNNTGSPVTEKGVLLSHGDSNIVANNVFKTFDTGIHVLAAATETQLSDNRYSNVTTKETIENTTAVSFQAVSNRYIIAGHGNKDVQLELKSGTDGLKLSNFSDGSAGIESTNNDNIKFFTNGEKFKVQSDGDVSILDGDLIIGTAGHGIDFSAQTQSTSTTDDEVLDHYEKGKWTPVVKKNDVANGTATVIHGRYVRIGKLCWLSMYARWNSGSNAQGTSGGWAIHGLPFTLQDDDPGTCRIYQSAPAGYFMIDGVDYFSNPTRWQINNSTYFDLYTGVSSADQAWTTGMMAVAFTGCFMIHE